MAMRKTIGGGQNVSRNVKQGSAASTEVRSGQASAATIPHLRWLAPLSQNPLVFQTTNIAENITENKT